MVDLIGWLLRVVEPTRAARCTACGKCVQGQIDSGGIRDHIRCENCGKMWNLYPQLVKEPANE